jgi:hypothetical protein
MNSTRRLMFIPAAIMALAGVAVACGSARVTTQPASGAAGTKSPAAETKSRKDDPAIRDIVKVQTNVGSDRALLLLDSAISECMKSAGFTYLVRLPAQMRGEGEDPNLAALKGLSDEAVLAWSQAQGGVVSHVDGQIASSGGCTDEAFKRVNLMTAFPDFASSLYAANSPGKRIEDAMYDAIAADPEVILKWYAQWPEVKA